MLQLYPTDKEIGKYIEELFCISQIDFYYSSHPMVNANT